MSAPNTAAPIRPSVKSSAGASTAHHERRVAASHEIRRDRRTNAIGKRRRERQSTERTENAWAADGEGAEDSDEPIDDTLLDQTVSQLTQTTPGSAERRSLLVRVRMWLASPRAHDADWSLIDRLLARETMAVLLAELTNTNATLDTLSEVCWCIANIAAGSYAHSLAVMPALPCLVAFLTQSTPLALCEHAAWALGNLASEDCEIRDQVVRAGAVAPLTARYIQSHAANTDSLQSLIHIAAWALANLAKSALADSANWTAPEFIVVALTDWTRDSSPISVEAAFLLAHIVHQSETAARAFLAGGLVDALQTRVRSLQSDNPRSEAPLSPSQSPSRASDVSSAGHSLSLPAADTESAHFVPLLRILEHVSLLLAPRELVALATSDLLAFLARCIDHPHRGVRKEALSNLAHLSAADSLPLAARLVDSGLVDRALAHLDAGQFDLVRPAVALAFNLCAQHQGQFVPRVLAPESVGRAVVRSLVLILRAHDADLAVLCVRFFALMLDHHSPALPLMERVEEAHGLEALEWLQNHPSPQVWREAAELMDRWFGDDADEEQADTREEQSQAHETQHWPAWRQQPQSQSPQQQQQQHHQHPTSVDCE